MTTISEGLLPGCITNFSTTLEILLLDSNKIYGSIPVGIGKFINLQRLEIWNNRWSGTIPAAIAELQNLGILGLQRYRFSGNIPPSIGNLKILFKLSLTYNLLEGNIPSTLGHLSSLLIALDVSVNKVTGSLHIEVRKLKNLEILDVSRNMFSHLRHQGAFKIFKSFIAECKALRNIRHRNLIKVLTACLGVDYQGNDFKALVYEFIHNRSPEKWLYPISKEDETYERPRNLNLLRRLNIAIDVASALNYLHHDCQPVTAHCDLKPSNVLLDDDMTARVGDFGLARFLPPTQYGVGNEVSTIGDVYSYGILLLELMIREKPSDIMFEGDMNLHKFAKMALPNHVKDIVDSILLNDDEKLVVRGDQKQTQAKINVIIECVISMVRIGVACSMESPQDRMKMTNVVHELQSIKNTLLGPKNLATCKEI
ncbi:hypothetical protein CUMW_245160 [Citrus unshiu]|uniref:Protein kinase domain-containing protein n=1 Tax=Citrus unshiu TaxID=55188 RepID=A0A2H5QNY1_CITUN|nr:hypothetical protein CUMW_245160 [Citrus unshiu]